MRSLKVLRLSWSSIFHVWYGLMSSDIHLGKDVFNSGIVTHYALHIEWCSGVLSHSRLNVLGGPSSTF